MRAEKSVGTQGATRGECGVGERGVGERGAGTWPGNRWRPRRVLPRCTPPRPGPAACSSEPRPLRRRASSGSRTPRAPARPGPQRQASPSLSQHRPGGAGAAQAGGGALQLRRRLKQPYQWGSRAFRRPARAPCDAAMSPELYGSCSLRPALLWSLVSELWEPRGAAVGARGMLLPLVVKN